MPPVTWHSGLGIDLTCSRWSEFCRPFFLFSSFFYHIFPFGFFPFIRTAGPLQLCEVTVINVWISTWNVDSIFFIVVLHPAKEGDFDADKTHQRGIWRKTLGNVKDFFQNKVKESIATGFKTVSHNKSQVRPVPLAIAFDPYTQSGALPTASGRWNEMLITTQDKGENEDRIKHEKGTLVCLFSFFVVSTHFPNKLFLSFKFCRTICYPQGQLQVQREVLKNACEKVGLNRMLQISNQLFQSISLVKTFSM